MTYNDLNKQQKQEYKKLCDRKYGESFVKSEDGEPLYFDDDTTMIDTTLLFDLLFAINYN